MYTRDEPAMAARANKPPTKAQTMSALADKTGLTKAQVNSVFDSLEELIGENLKRHGEFKISNWIKISVAHKKATKARPGRNPFTGESIMIKAKPAHDVVRVRALKALKDKV